MPLRIIEEYKPKTDAQVHENPILNRVYQNRGITGHEDLDYSLKGLISPFKMKGIDDAAELLIKHILNDSKILVVGDYDCDGATATTIAVQGLRMLGAKKVGFTVPDRLTQGYGLSPSVVNGIAHKKPDLIVTVDNGIASFDGAKAVSELEHKCDLLITDHHLPANDGTIPIAKAVVNPSQPGCEFPSKAIAGCGVIFYVITALRIRMREKGVFPMLGIEEPNIAPLLDVLAIGTIADVVPFDKNNRIMVNAGLARINAGMARPAIRHLLELGNREIGKIVATDGGFVIGPRLNAAGRLDDMSIGIRCLLSEDDNEAWLLAQRLDDLNARRKEMSANSEEEALDIMESENITSEANGVCLYNPDWHEGIVGILAGRIKEKLNRPTICLTQTHETAIVSDVGVQALNGQYDEASKKLNEMLIEKKEEDERRIQIHATRDPNAPAPKLNQETDAFAAIEFLKKEIDAKAEPRRIQTIVDKYIKKFGEIKGSCRSVEGVHLKHVLDTINKNHPEVLNKFGGHAMAAGVGIRMAHFEAFRGYFDKEVAKDLTDEVKNGKLPVDIINMDPSLMTLETAELLSSAGPWGQHFWAPSFGGKFELVDFRVLKEKHLKMQVKPHGSDTVFDAISFNCVERGSIPISKGNIVDLVFKLDVNEWRGRKSVQLMVDFVQDPQLIKELEMIKKEHDEVKDSSMLDGVEGDQKRRHREFQKKMHDSLVL
jgi:single-stranded-DNA-specific exonuclease